MSRTTEIDKLKYWLDGEISILHAMLAFIAMLLLDNAISDVVFSIYIGYSVLYALVRFSFVYSKEKDYLSVFKK